MSAAACKTIFLLCAAALCAAAMQAGEYEPFLRIVASLRQQAPEVAEALGLHR